MMVVVIRELVLVSICNTSKVIWNQHRLNICRDNFGLKSGFGGGGIKSSSSQLPICRAGLQLNLPSGLGSDRKTEIRDRNIQNFSKKIIHNFVQKMSHILTMHRCTQAMSKQHKGQEDLLHQFSLKTSEVCPSLSDPLCLHSFSYILNNNSQSPPLHWPKAFTVSVKKIIFFQTPPWAAVSLGEEAGEVPQWMCWPLLEK